MAVGNGTAAVSLPADEQILITREFDAPAALVFKAWTTPELIEQWWHANRGEIRSIEVDLRPGGRWRYVMVTPDGFEVGFHGEYREVIENERIVATEAYEGIPDPDANAAVTTTTFSEAGGRTTVTMLVEHKDKAGRDMHIESGMEAGLQDALDLLEQVAVALGWASN